MTRPRHGADEQRPAPRPGAPPSPPGTGARVLAGRYHLADIIGRGTMGVVWQGYDVVAQRRVAVKEVVLPPDMSAQDRSVARERAQREARAIAALNHPNVIAFRDLLDEDGHPWIVMELVFSESLADAIRRAGPVPPRRAATIGLAVLGALEAAHAAGITHRDVKPSNILLTDDGRVKLTDFGIAREASDSSITGAGMLVGSPSYIPPEVIQGAASAPTADLWGLGATLFAAVEGRAPFDAADPMTTLHAVVSEPTPPMESAGPLAEVIEGLLQKDPEQRLSTVRSRHLLLDALRTLDRDAPEPVRPVLPPVVDGTPSPAPLAPPVPAPVPAIPPPVSGPPAVPLLAPEDRDADQTWMIAPIRDEPPADPPASGPPASGPPASHPPFSGQPDPDPSQPTGSSLFQPDRAAGDPPLPPHLRLPARLQPLAAPDQRDRRSGSTSRLLVGAALVLAVCAGAAFGAYWLTNTVTGRDHSPAAASTGPAGRQDSTTTTPYPGYVSYRAPEGYSVAVPKSWRAGPRRGGVIDFTDPASDRFVRFISGTAGDRSPVDTLAAAEHSFAADHSGYHRLGIQALPYRNYQAADWSFTYAKGGVPRQVLYRSFVVGRKSYGIYVSAPQAQFSHALPVFTVTTRTFRPS